MQETIPVTGHNAAKRPSLFYHAAAFDAGPIRPGIEGGGVIYLCYTVCGDSLGSVFSHGHGPDDKSRSYLS